MSENDFSSDKPKQLKFFKAKPWPTPASSDEQLVTPDVITRQPYEARSISSVMQGVDLSQTTSQQGFQDDEQNLEKELRATDPRQYLELKNIFPVKDLVKKPIQTRSELRERLEDLPVGEVMPDTSLLETTSRYPDESEFVEIDKIVGATEGGVVSWVEISKAPTRGLENIAKIVKAIQDGQILITGAGDQLQVYEIDGRYFAAQGRHRIAAMKALGIPFAPMWVQHFRDRSLPQK